MNGDMRRGLAVHGLTEARAHALWQIAANEGTTQAQLAHALKVTPRNVTALIDALETAGFVRRDTHATDRRATAMALTPKGHSAVAAMQADLQTMAELLFGPVSEDELTHFIAQLQALARRIAALPPVKG